jgi:hypothetical protein
MTAEDVDGLEYNKLNAAGAVAKTLDVPRGFQFMIKAFISMFNNYCNQQSGVLDCTSILKEDFDTVGVSLDTSPMFL